MDKARKKRLEKQIKALEEQVERHRKKLEIEEGEKDTTKDYWKKEIEGFEKQVEEKKKLMRK